MNFLTQTLKLPWFIAFLVIAFEFVGALGLVVGFASKLWALGLMLVMFGAIGTTSAQHGSFMN